MSSTRCAKCRKEPATQRCSVCHRTYYCNPECQKKHWKIHNHICPLTPPTATVEGVIIHCEENRAASGIFERTSVEPTHPVWTEGYVSPTLKIAGVEILIYRHLLDDRSPNKRGLDNQIATFLMVEEEDGFAKPEWQKNVGDVTVVRANGNPLTPREVETLWMFTDYLMEIYPDDPNIAQGQINRKSFDHFCKRYKEQQGYQDLQLPL
ncbi:hypothetical protein DL96DRAFT_869058 [Flagelloscypha sp. PMI_526]|nr:hypothetical protein DL96DRAFT_869058 [Flagelloscypha sp. PMI_526]